MIDFKRTKKYCCEDITLIENYAKAINDNTQTWEIHHRLEVQDDKILSYKELIDNGLYWGRPACELIFLTKSDHNKLHKIGKCHSEESKKKISKSKIGKKRSETTKQKIREAMKKYWENKKDEDDKIHYVEKNSSISLF